MKTLLNQKCKILCFIFICLSFFIFTACGSDDKKESTPSYLPGITNVSPELSSSSWRLTQINCTGPVTISLTYDSNNYLTRADVNSTGHTEYFEFDYNTNNLLSGIHTEKWDDGEIKIGDGTLDYSPEGKVDIVDWTEDTDSFYADVASWNGYSPVQAAFNTTEDGDNYNGTIAFSYDSAGRLTQVAFNITPYGIVNRIDYSYSGYNVTLTQYDMDDGGQMEHIYTVVLTFDTENRLTDYKATEYDGNEIGETKTSTFSYDENGNIEEMTVVRQDYDNGAPSGNPETYHYTFDYSEETSIPAPNDIIGVNYSNVMGTECWAPSFIDFEDIDNY